MIYYWIIIIYYWIIIIIRININPININPSCPESCNPEGYFCRPASRAPGGEFFLVVPYANRYVPLDGIASSRLD